MKITNKVGLPEALVRAVQNDSYSKGNSDYSTTELAVPSRIVALKRKFADQLEEDASDLIYALIGKLGHSILEHAGTADIIEKRLFWEIDGRVISGQVDVVDGTVLEDWKFTSIYTSKAGVKFEWQAQASVNRYLCEKNNIPITNARYVAIYRDWSAPKVAREPGYPKHQVEVFDVPLWSMDETEHWIRQRIQSHEDAMVNLPLCSDEDRWSRGGGYAVKKFGRKTALRVFPEEMDAVNYISTQSDSGKLSIEKREGSNLRCQFYCPVSKFCDQYHALATTQQTEEDDSF